MYKVVYYMSGGNTVQNKIFENLNLATIFANQQPLESVLEIKYYDDVDNRKPDRN